MRRKSKSWRGSSSQLSGPEREGQVPHMNPGDSNPQKTHHLNAGSQEHSGEMNTRTNLLIPRIMCCAVGLVTQSCLTLCDPMDCSPSGSSVHGILQAGLWSGLPLPSPGDLPDTGIKPRSLTSPALAGRFFTTTAPGKPP